MKKAEPITDEIRSEYRREDLGTLMRGMYATRYAKKTNVVVIDLALTNAFPNSDAGNQALRCRLAVATSATRMLGRLKRPTRKRAAA